MKQKTNILIETSPLGNANVHRGIGTYTRLLVENLEKLPQLNVQKSTLEIPPEFKPDLVHYPYFDLFFSTLPLTHSTKFVVTIHDVIPLKFSDHYDPGVRGSVKFLKQKFALSKVGAIITDSEASKKDIVEHLSISEEKIHVVYLAANQELQATSEKEINRARRKYKLPKNYLLYVGDINYNKNVPQLIKALKYLPPEIKLVCLGRNFKPQEIPEWQWIETQLALSNVEKRVKFVTDLGSDALSDLSAIYSGAICYVQPSLYEGFGLPVLEALQCKTPVVCADNSSLLEVGGEVVIFTDIEGKDIARGIEEVLNWSKSKRVEKIRAGFKWSQTFSWEKAAKETARVYKKVLG